MSTKEKRIVSRSIQKHDLEVNWNKANGFIPYKGEFIIYDIEIDENGNTLELPEGRTEPYTYERFKIGDGKTPVASLPFTINAHNHIYYGVCETDAATVEKTVEINDFILKTGTIAVIKFINRCGVANATLNISGTGSFPIYNYGTSGTINNDSTGGWAAGATQLLVYDGTGWVRDYWRNTTTAPSLGSLGIIWAECTKKAAAGGTLQATSILSNYTEKAGSIFAVKFKNAVPAGAQLKIDASAARPIYYRNQTIRQNIILGDSTALFTMSRLANGTIIYQLLAVDIWGTTKLDAVQTTTTVPQIYAKMANGGQFMLNTCKDSAQINQGTVTAGLVPVYLFNNSVDDTVPAGGWLVSATPQRKAHVVNKDYVDTNFIAKIAESQTITGNLAIAGKLQVQGTTETVDAVTYKIENNVIEFNPEKEHNETWLTGLAINKGRDGETDLGTYGIMYDPSTDAVKLGFGQVDEENKFKFNENESAPIATREEFDDSWEDDAIFVFDKTTKKFKYSGKTLSGFKKEIQDEMKSYIADYIETYMSTEIEVNDDSTSLYTEGKTKEVMTEDGNLWLYVGGTNE